MVLMRGAPGMNTPKCAPHPQEFQLNVIDHSKPGDIRFSLHLIYFDETRVGYIEKSAVDASVKAALQLD
jgi:hypothetical protein